MDTTALRAPIRQGAVLGDLQGRLNDLRVCFKMMAYAAFLNLKGDWAGLGLNLLSMR